MRRLFFLSLWLMLLTASAAYGVPIYSGSLSSATGGIDGTGVWLDKTLLPEHQQPDWTPVTIIWTVSRNPDMSWRYAYDLSVHRGDISHLIIETSTDFGPTDIFNNSEDFELQLHRSGSGNPGIPDDLYGVKFEGPAGTTKTVTFDSWRMPVWGHFYAKDGKLGGERAAAWDMGFTGPAPYPDVGPSNGSESFYILVPDTYTDPAAEPATIVLLGLALSGIIFCRRARNR